jgi:hypothetical protein
MVRKHKMFFLAPLAILAMVLLAGLGGLVVRELWNGLLPPLFGFPAVTFWQAFGLLVLCRILFGGLSGSGHSGSHVRRRLADRIADRVAERWGAMTPEERERVRRGLRGPSPSEGPGQPGL